MIEDCRKAGISVCGAIKGFNGLPEAVKVFAKAGCIQLGTSRMRQIKELIMEEPQVRGAYDLFINNYGPGRDYASVHVELPDTLTVEEVDQITRRVQQKVYTGTGVVLTGVGVYSYNTRDEEAARIRNTVMETILQHEWALQVHAFSADTKAKKMRFDVVFSFDIDQNEGYETIMKEIETLYPDYTITITSDMDIA